MKSSLLALTFVYRLAVPGYHYEFPRDYYNHPEFQTEWWYYTGNVHTTEGRRFGFELTFFRQGVDRETHETNVWDLRDAWLAHLALSDVAGNRFFHTERLNRSGAGIAGAEETQQRVWNGNWQVQWTAGGEHLRAIADKFQFDLVAQPAKPPVIHGIAGVDHGAHYFSETRLNTRGWIVVDGQRFMVDGLSWMDHEFFTHQLAANQSGWDWFSVQLSDGSELMLYQLRRKDGSADPDSSGTYVDAQGHGTHLKFGDFQLQPGKKWSVYPVAWTVRVPSLGIELSETTPLEEQELTGRTAYWEGAVDYAGTKQGRAVKGSGYLEMTGYRGAPPLP